MKIARKIFGILLIIMLCSWVFAFDNSDLTMYAHSGGTDSKGGHYDTETQEYHYHHGYPAHQHINGKCPYDYDDRTDSDSDDSGNGNIWLWVIILVGIGGTILFVVIKRMKDTR